LQSNLPRGKNISMNVINLPQSWRKLAKYIDDKNLCQKEIAKAVDVHPGSLNAVLCGRKPGSLKLYNNICDHLKKRSKKA